MLEKKREKPSVKRYMYFFSSQAECSAVIIKGRKNGSFFL